MTPAEQRASSRAQEPIIKAGLDLRRPRPRVLDAAEWLLLVVVVVALAAPIALPGWWLLVAR